MTIFFTAEAENDLQEIEKNSPDQARKLLLKISDLTSNPEQLPPDHVFTREEKVLVLRANEYRVFYTISDLDIYVLGLTRKSNYSFKPKPLHGSA